MRLSVTELMPTKYVAGPRKCWGVVTETRWNFSLLYTWTAVAVHDVGSGLDVAMTIRARVTWVRKESHAMSAWFRMALGALAQRDIEVPIYLSHPPPFRYDGWTLFFLLGLRFRNCRPLLVPWFKDVVHWSKQDFSVFPLTHQDM